MKFMEIMPEIRRKVIGEGELVTERIKKEFVSKNVTRQIIERTVRKAAKLECGHLIDARQGYLPTSNARCHECEEQRDK